MLQWNLTYIPNTAMLTDLSKLPFTKSICVLTALMLMVIMIIGGCTSINREHKNSDSCFAEIKCIGQKIYKNETGGDVKNLIFWSPNEDFASLGVGHFIWYPQGGKQGFKETFPELIRYLQANGRRVPDWLSRQIQIGSLWNNKEQLEQDREGEKFQSLQQLLLDTIDLQVSFLFQRLDNALPVMLTATHPQYRALITDRFNTMKKTPGGLYPLVDYVNFKGEGIAVTERYKGLGWGLLQVLASMNDVPAGPEALREFSRAADFVLTRRVENAPAGKNEQRWLSGWRARLNTYL